MRKIILILIVVIVSSCKNGFTIYISNPKNYDEDIFGYELNEFFKNEREVKKIKFKNKYLLAKEILKIKEILNKSDLLPLRGERFGSYKYAFIINGDTLYSDSTLSGWRYKNKVCRYDSIDLVLKNEILKITQ
jgi:hypothetical protein